MLSTRFTDEETGVERLQLVHDHSVNKWQGQLVLKFGTLLIIHHCQKNLFSPLR